MPSETVTTVSTPRDGTILLRPAMNKHVERWIPTDEGWYDPHLFRESEYEDLDVTRTVFGHATVVGSNKTLRVMHTQYWDRLKREEQGNQMLWAARMQVVNRQFLSGRKDAAKCAPRARNKERFVE
jgi:hypothetical protein